MLRDFDDLETDGERGQGGSATRLHALISVEGEVTSKLLPASGALTIGRASNCDVVIQHGSVSRRHATLLLSPLEIVDAGSRNGTRVHGKAVATDSPTSITVGDAIQIGEATIVIQSAPTSFDGKPMVDTPDRESPLARVAQECARSARTRSPFAVVHVVTRDGKPSEVLGHLRNLMRTTDLVSGDGKGSFQVMLVDTGGNDVAIVVNRIAELLRSHNVTAQLGVARYPDDGVVAEQLTAHAYEQLSRDPDAAPTAMDNVRALVRQVAAGELSVLILGETGVGKELYAEMIHRLSSRAAKPFVKLNCSALVDTLIESELFGHERGAFTGATSAHPGLLETAHGGTVFLDEIGELALGVQAKLLRVLEERVVRRIGATTGRKIDVRFVFATNRDLLEEVDTGRFRRDLYYRINGVTIAIPALRDRRSEIVPLARAFASHTRPGAPPMLGDDVVSALVGHAWPGNIRELRNTIERAVLLSSGGSIRTTHLVLDPGRETRPSARESRDHRDSQPHMRESRPTIPIPFAEGGSSPTRPSSQSLASAVADVERARILEALEQCGGNQSRAAKQLGISRTTLQARIDSYGIKRPRKP